MARMGLADHQYVAVRHSDTDKDHVHIVASRIALDGSLYQGRYEALNAIKLTQELELKHGLTITKGLEDGPSPVSTPSKNEMEKAIRTGEAPPRVSLQQIVDAALSQPSSVFDFMDRLEAAGVEVKANVASTGKMNGFSFKYGGVPFKASDLGKSYGWKALQERGLSMSKIETVRHLSTVQTGVAVQEVKSTTEAQLRLIQTLEQLAVNQSNLTEDCQTAITSLIDSLTKSSEAAEAMITGAAAMVQQSVEAAQTALVTAQEAAETAQTAAQTSAKSQDKLTKALVAEVKTMKSLTAENLRLVKNSRNLVFVVAVLAVGMILVIVWLTYPDLHRLIHPTS